MSERSLSLLQRLHAEYTAAETRLTAALDGICAGMDLAPGATVNLATGEVTLPEPDRAPPA